MCLSDQIPLPGSRSTGAGRKQMYKSNQMYTMVKTSKADHFLGSSCRATSDLTYSLTCSIHMYLHTHSCFVEHYFFCACGSLQHHGLLHISANIVFLICYCVTSCVDIDTGAVWSQSLFNIVLLISV